MNLTESNRHGDTITMKTSAACNLVMFRCLNRREDARAILPYLSFLEPTHGRAQRGQPPYTIEFICDGPEKREILGSLGIKLCQGPTASEMLEQVDEQRVHIQSKT